MRSWIWSKRSDRTISPGIFHDAEAWPVPVGLFFPMPLAETPADVALHPTVVVWLMLAGALDKQ